MTKCSCSDCFHDRLHIACRGGGERARHQRSRVSSHRHLFCLDRCVECNENIVLWLSVARGFRFIHCSFVNSARAKRVGQLHLRRQYSGTRPLMSRVQPTRRKTLLGDHPVCSSATMDDRQVIQHGPGRRIAVARGTPPKALGGRNDK